MNRYPVFIGGDVTSSDKFMVKLVSTTMSKLPKLNRTTLTAPDTLPPRELGKSRAQERSDRAAAKLLTSDSNDSASVTDRWRVTDPEGEKNFSGVAEKAADSQDCYLVLVYDKQTSSFHAIKPTSLYLTPDAAKPRFTSIEDAEAFTKARSAAKPSKRPDDEAEDGAFDIKSMMRAKQSDTSELFSKENKKKSGSRTVREEWDWQRNDDDEGIENDNDIDDDEESTFVPEVKKKTKKTETQERMEELLRPTQGYEDDDDDNLAGFADGDSSDEDEEDADNAMTDGPAGAPHAGGNAPLTGTDRPKRLREADDLERAASKKIKRDMSTICREDVVAVFAAGGLDPFTVTLGGTELLMRLLGSAKGYSDEQKRQVKDIIGRFCDRDAAGGKMFKLKR